MMDNEPINPPAQPIPPPTESMTSEVVSEPAQAPNTPPEAVQSLPVEPIVDKPVEQPQPEQKPAIVEPATQIEKPVETKPEAPRVDKNAEKKEKVIEYLQRMPFYKWAAAFAMISHDTLDRWRKEDEYFAYRCEAAKSAAIDHFGKRATPDFILKSTDPETFKERKEIDLLSGGKPIMGGTAHVSTNDSVPETPHTS